MEQRRHRPRRAVRAELHARGRRRHGRPGQGHRDQRAVPAEPSVLVVARRGGRAGRPVDVHQLDAAHDVRARREGCRVPQEALRGAEGSAAVRRHRVQRGLPRHQPVGAAAHAEAPRGRAVRGDPRARRAPTSTSARSRTSSSTTSRERGAEVVTNREVRKLKRQNDGTWRIKWRNSIGRTPGRDRGALRVRRRGRLGAQAAAALRHPRDQGLRRLPDRRAVAQDHQPRARRPAQGEGLLAGLGRRAADVGAAPRHARRRRRDLPAVRPVRDVQPEVPQERLDASTSSRRCARATSGR